VKAMTTRQEIDDKVEKFYASFEWRRLRYLVLKNYGAMCMLCNKTDTMLHVDHIKPLRKYWELRLVYKNLQVLCEECNHGKGSWDETDWRPLSKKQIQLEYKKLSAQEQFDRQRENEREAILKKIAIADAEMQPAYRQQKHREMVQRAQQRRKYKK
jgi:hypothetical protein